MKTIQIDFQDGHYAMRVVEDSHGTQKIPDRAWEAYQSHMKTDRSWQVFIRMLDNKMCTNNAPVIFAKEEEGSIVLFDKSASVTTDKMQIGIQQALGRVFRGESKHDSIVGALKTMKE